MKRPRVAIIMGSSSDQGVMSGASEYLNKFGIDSDTIIVSAHRVPAKVRSLAMSAEKKYDLIIAGAGLAAHLPGVIASYTTIPVIGVPISSKSLSGFDALYSIVQMPTGIPVATVAIDGAKNAGILAAEILALKYPAIAKKIKTFRQELSKK